MKEDKSKDISSAIIKSLSKKTLGKITKLIIKTMPTSLIIISIILLIFFMVTIVSGLMESINIFSSEEKYTEEEKEEFKKETLGFFNPDKIKAYNTLEQKSYPKNTKVNAEIITTNLKNKETNKTKYKVKFNIENMTKQHRLYWQLLAATDIVSGLSEYNDNNTVIEQAKKNLMPKFTYTFDTEIDENGNLKNPSNFKYKKIRTEEIKTKTKEYINGKLDQTYTSHKIKKTIIPQPYIEKVISPFFNITYEYKKQTIDETEDTNTENYYDTDNIYDEEGNIIGTTRTKTVVTTYAKTKTEQYIIDNVTQEVNSRLENYIKSNKFKGKLGEEDIYNIYEFGSQFKDAADFSTYMGEYMCMNNNLNIPIISPYLGKEGNHIVTEDTNMFQIPIKFKHEKNNLVKVTSFFGNRTLIINGVKEKNFHTGIDFAMPVGTIITASKDGLVTYKGWRGGYGYTIEIQHQNGYKTLYAHNSRLYLKVGEKVKKGDIVALSGNTGKSTGPHLHFEIRHNNKPIDPYPLLNIKKLKWRKNTR